jgi:LysM repeat protein
VSIWGIEKSNSVRALNLILLGSLLSLAGCASNRSDNEQALKLHLGDYLLSDTNATPGSIYEVRIYVIAKGDTLENIANKFQVSLSDLMTINPGLTPTRLYIGQKIRIYEQKRV